MAARRKGSSVLDRKRPAPRRSRPLPSLGSRAVAAATTYVWRRLHGGTIIAEASPVRGMGSWHVSGYPTNNNAEAVHEPQSFSLLRDAHIAADELVRRHFKHTCRTGVCGRWLRWIED